MNFEPQKFFIGLIDFFSVLLPGALLTYVVKDDAGPLLLGKDAYQNLIGPEAWLVFLFSSYLLGHFIFLLGAAFVDELFDRIRNATRDGQTRELAKGNKLASRFTRSIAKWFIKKDADKALNLAMRIKEHYLSPAGASAAINAFQWCKAKLLKDEEATAVIQRFEADSKFFRSLLIVLLAFIGWGLWNDRAELAAVSLALMLLAFWRYVDQRQKAITHAYWYVLTLESQLQGGFRPQQTGSLTHAGGVVYRQAGEQLLYLVVQAKLDPREWVLPKGHIEAGEPIRETAVREVREETGVWARIITELEPKSYSLNGRSIHVQFYLMEALEEGKSDDLRRKCEWLTISDAVSRVGPEQNKESLRFAEERRKRIKAQEPTS